MTSPSRGFTYRMLADALTSPDPFLMGVIDIGLGPFPTSACRSAEEVASCRCGCAITCAK
ncbi:hypothetical protein [Dokdonella sp.]|uniref:hypothetical protein n=1 Tax=Dokdonella sp. TaxID=2291710 RepID=UPI0035283735